MHVARKQSATAKSLHVIKESKHRMFPCVSTLHIPKKNPKKTRHWKSTCILRAEPAVQEQEAFMQRAKHHILTSHDPRARQT